MGKYLARDAAKQWQDFLLGLYRYQHTSIPRQDAPWTMIAQHQSTALKFLPAKKKKQKSVPVVLVPSLINRFHILDLSPQQSFARFLQDCGHDVYLIDWHHDLNKKLPASLDACITSYLLPLLQQIPAKTYHLLGYCMGGTLSIAAAALQPKSIQSLTLIATPWDFHQPDTTIGQHIIAYLDELKRQDPSHALFKADWLQMLFWRHDPLTALHKFQRLATLPLDNSDAKTFILAEDWLNDGIDLPFSLLDECARVWYGGNHTAKSLWTVAGKKITLQHLAKVPMHSVVAERDRLVPTESSLSLAKQKKNATVSAFSTGHIGLFAGNKSKNIIWPQLQQFLSHHNTR